MAWQVVVSPVRDLAKAKGIPNAWQLSKQADIAGNTALKWWDGFTTVQINGSVLYALCFVLGCEPTQIISGEWIDDE